MDLQMPEMDGISATQAIRAEGRFGELPIIAMTAHAMVEERERCLAAGMNDHVTKPIEPDVLYQTLARWFQRRPAAETPVRAEKRPGAAEAALPQVPGVDTASGLRRVAGNLTLYRNLLGKFVEGQGAAADAIRKALREGDRALAERVSHTLKGVAGNIGAAAVQATAGAVERAIRDGTAADALIGALESELSAVVGALRDAPGGAATGAAADETPAADAADARHVLQKLEAYLADSDGETADYLQRTRRRCAPRSGPTASPASARRWKNSISETPSTGCGAPRRRKGNSMADALDFTEKQSILIVDDTPDNLTLMTGCSRTPTRRGGEQRRARAEARGDAALPGSHPARHHDAGDRRLRGLPAPEAGQGDRRDPGDLPDREERGGGRAEGLRRGLRGLHHQADQPADRAGAREDAPHR